MCIDCYIGLGGNYPDTLGAMKRSLVMLQRPEIGLVSVSRLYRSSPVDCIAQSDYLNAVCRLSTTLSLPLLGEWLEGVEVRIGKVSKAKNAPRLIDLDLLFYGSLITQTEKWKVPHPKWYERLFVLEPLADVTDVLPIPGPTPQQLLRAFSTLHQVNTLYAEKGWENTCVQYA